MMLIVAIISDTGVFNYVGFLAYKATNGRFWPLTLLLGAITAVVSAFLDNVTTVLLMTPVIIQLCERSEINPVRVLIANVIFSNIGGTATAIGELSHEICCSFGNKLAY